MKKKKKKHKIISTSKVKPKCQKTFYWLLKPIIMEIAIGRFLYFCF